MALQHDASRDASQAFYEDFSLQVGLRDWLMPNPRHARLRVAVDDVLGSRASRPSILDVGCGAGVMTHYLARYGAVTGTDFSAAAIDAARRFVPEADFVAGALDDLPDGRRYDVITLFDVLEHIPTPDRPVFLTQIATLLTADGIVLLSTPYPAFTARRREAEDPSLQIIDEVVELAELLPELAAAGLQLTRYEAYDVFAGSPEYQLLVVRPASASDGGPPRLLDRRARVPSARLERLRNAARLVRARRWSVARWFLTARAPHVDS